MLRSHLKLALRNLIRHRSFSLINILGLTVGIASCVLIGLYIFNEMSFDRFHKKYKQIYRVNKITNEKGGKAQKDGITPGLLAPGAMKEIPGVATATRFRPWFNEMLVSYDSTRLKLDDVAYADARFFEIFDFPLVRGDRHTALSEPYTAVITESVARRYFKEQDPIGKTLTTLNDIPVKVTGVALDPPHNSSIRFTMLISWETITTPASQEYFSWMNNWTTQVNYTFLELKERADPIQVGTQVSTMMHKYRDDTEFQFRPYLQSLSDVHLHSEGILYAESFHTNTYKIIYTLMIIAGFILLIACFNFLNLSTAGALGRAKETGVQKVLGARKGQLTAKFFAESFLLCLISMFAALALVVLVIPGFNAVAGTALSWDLLLQAKILWTLAGLLIAVSLIAGIYPSIFLARFKSTDVFRSILKTGNDKWLRKSLVTTQFALSILLIIATIVVKRQMNYTSTKDLGFQRDQVMVVPLTNTGMEALSKEYITALKSFAGIQSVAISNRIPGQTFNGYGILPEGRRQEEHLLANVLETDADFASTFGLQVIQGRYFSPRIVTDTTDAIVINEAMARYLNWKEPVGKQMEIFEARKGKVIGVVKDFNFASLRKEVEPLAIILNDNPLYLSVKLKGGNIAASLSGMQKEWQKLSKGYPFDYFFMDEQLDRFYKTDQRLLNVLSIFAILAIVIACMGLFGLSIYTARQRTKEIGIRKVLGATAGGIALLLSRDFMKLVVIAALVAFPLAWWAMNSWLNDFAYRIDIGAWIFILAGFMVATIALLTVGFQALKAAFRNPVKALRSE